MFVAGVQLALQVLAVPGDAEAEHPEAEGDEHIALHRHVLPGRIGNRGLYRSQHVEQTNDQYQGCLLYTSDAADE